MTTREAIASKNMQATWPAMSQMNLKTQNREDLILSHRKFTLMRIYLSNKKLLVATKEGAS